MALIGTDNLNNSMTAGVVGTGGGLNTCFLELFTNVGLSPANSTVYSDLEVPLYAGYSRQAVVWSAPVRQPDNSYAVMSQVVLNKMTADGSPCIVTGYALTTGTTTPVLEAAEVLPTPISVSSAGDFCAVVAIFGVPAGVDLGDAAQII